MKYICIKELVKPKDRSLQNRESYLGCIFNFNLNIQVNPEYWMSIEEYRNKKLNEIGING